MVSKLTFFYEDASGTSRSITYGRVDSSPSTSNVKRAADALVANGSILKFPPVEVTGATLYQTQESQYDLYD